MESVAGARTVRCEHGGLQNEYSGGAGGTAVQQAHVQRLRRDDGESRWAECAQRVDEQRPQDRGERGIFQRHGRGAGGYEGCFGGSELRGFGPAKGRPSGGGITFLVMLRAGLERKWR